jgi:hypothetical protein
MLHDAARGQPIAHPLLQHEQPIPVLQELDMRFAKVVGERRKQLLETTRLGCASLQGLKMIVDERLNRVLEPLSLNIQITNVVIGHTCLLGKASGARRGLAENRREAFLVTHIPCIPVALGEEDLNLPLGIWYLQDLSGLRVIQQPSVNGGFWWRLRKEGSGGKNEGGKISEEWDGQPHPPITYPADHSGEACRGRSEPGGRWSACVYRI